MTGSSFDTWSRGYGALQHSPETQARIAGLERQLTESGTRGDGHALFDVLQAADRLCSAAMWLIVHETYARNVYPDGRPLAPEDFKPKPEGHTGGSLNMAPAYAGYLAANVIAGVTRSWLMGQGRCVAAIDSLNLLAGNLTLAHAARYQVTAEGLTRYVRDFYSCALDSRGRQDSPLGSHVNAHTAGGIAEGGYLGFAELQYVHMPLPGERLVVFLSDGAFEEQRGSDWASRWWRAEDSGWVMPIMINNGRRIDQRTTMSQQGGADWFCDHLRLNGFDPFVFDGRDPAAFVWAIFEMERRLAAAAARVARGEARYPIPLPYGIAVAPKGAGFAGEGTNLAHNLPLLANPHTDPGAALRFNEAARKLWVSPDDLQRSAAVFQCHQNSSRVRERDHPLAGRNPVIHPLDTLPSRQVPIEPRNAPERWTFSSPMDAVDQTFASLVRANPHLRPRVGNPDEMKSNRLTRTLELLKFRVSDPEPGIPESILGGVITALNEEAVVSAALANKGGINLAHTYEAFGPKMLGAVRQEVIFAENCVRAGRPQNWLSIPIVMTSHTWENGKNEHSHQDPTFAEAMMGESWPFSRVVFPADFNTAAAATAGLFETRGQVWTLVTPKAAVFPDLFTPAEARRMLDEGRLRLEWAGHRPEEAKLVLAAVGAYQLIEVFSASRRLCERGVPHEVVYLFEPARMEPLPNRAASWVVVTHTRRHVIHGLLAPMVLNGAMTVLGYRNEGGTLDTPAMMAVNRCTWADAVHAAARLIEMPPERLLSPEELAALNHECSPRGVLIPNL